MLPVHRCLQHPYLYDEGIEPRGLSAEATHEKLIDGSAKLRFLKSLLPKLKERGHRVLLFSQFVIALDVVEDFLVGEGYKFLRLVGRSLVTSGVLTPFRMETPRVLTVKSLWTNLIVRVLTFLSSY